MSLDNEEQSELQLPEAAAPAEPATTEPETPAIEVRELTRVYGRVKAIDGVSFSVGRGEVVGFLGPNGAGKSTTMRILCGLLQATSGVARVCGLSVASEAHLVKRKIGYMPETNPLPEDLRVQEYLRYRGKLKGLGGKELKRRVGEAMDTCDLTRKAGRKLIGALSKGFRQRVGIADAILAEPEVIIMDEPTIGLDPHQIRAIRELIDQLRGRMTVMLSSHILAEIEACCDRVIIINRGRIVANGSPEALRAEFLPNTHYRLVADTTEEGLEALLHGVHPELTLLGTRKDDDNFPVFELEAPATANVAEPLLELLARTEVKLQEFAREQPRLEEVFMAATKRSWEEEMELTRNIPEA